MKYKLRICLVTFAVLTAVFALGAFIDIVTVESNAGFAAAAVLEALVLLLVPVISLKAEKYTARELKMSAKDHLFPYFTGYVFAIAATIASFFIIGYQRFFPEPEGFLDFTGIGIAVLGYMLIPGLIWAVIFRGVVALIRMAK